MIGIDEVGRGCWAGPLLVVAARQSSELPTGLKDSKLLSRTIREQLYDHIITCCEIGEGWVEPAEIDELGLTGAMKLAVRRALESIDARPDEPIIMDGKINYCDDTYSNVACYVKADSLYPIVSAASVYAKVSRDRYMAEQSNIFPQYAFETHVGYGTAAHIRAIQAYGICALHRRSFKPIQAFVA